MPDVGSGDDDDAFVDGGTGCENKYADDGGDDVGMGVFKLSSGSSHNMVMRKPDSKMSQEDDVDTELKMLVSMLSLLMMGGGDHVMHVFLPPSMW